MEMPKPPVVLLVFLASFLAVPLIYTLNKLALMKDSKWVFASGLIFLPLFGIVAAVIVRYSPGKREPLFYVFSIFSFTAVVDLFIALELDGYVQGFMEFYLREGEPYLRSSYGTMINWWDGIGHFSMYIGMIALMCSQRDYRLLGLYWVGSITNSMIVFMPGNMIGNNGVRWSYLLNVPYVYYPIYAGVRFLRDGMKIKHKMRVTTQTICETAIDWTFVIWFVIAAAIAMFRMISSMGCDEPVTRWYISDIEPYLIDPAQYGKTQALCYFYYYAPFYVAAIYAIINPGQTWIKDLSLIHAGASMQAQLVFIASSLKWRTHPKFQVPGTMIAQSIFWTVNLCLVIISHLFAVYCHRDELGVFVRKVIIPRVKAFIASSTPNVEIDNANDLKKKFN